MELPNIIRLDHFYSQKQYTKAGNLSVNTTRNRIKSQLIASMVIDGRVYIDILQSPPTARYFKPQAKVYASLPEGIDAKRLVQIDSYAVKTKQTANKFYVAILYGKIFALVLADEVFCYQDEIEQL